MVVQWLSGCTLALKWHWIGARLFEWLSIGNQAIGLLVQWLFGSSFSFKWYWIGTRLVELLSIGNQVS